MKHAWWSDKQRKIYGEWIYRAPDGRNVNCTCVSETLEEGPKFDDTRYLGEVVEYVETVKPPVRL